MIQEFNASLAPAIDEETMSTKNLENEKDTELQSIGSSERQSRIQELDDSFFEQFNSIVRRKSINHEETVFLEHCLELGVDVSSICERVDDSDFEVFLGDDDEEQHEKCSKVIRESLGWNVEDLYEKLLCQIVNNGSRLDQELSEDCLVQYVQDAFKMSNEKHEQILMAARNQKPPEICLDMEIIEARDLQRKAHNSLADPFATVYLDSNPTHRYNTSVKSGSENPVWDEHFSLSADIIFKPIYEKDNDAILIVEVWDFNTAETVRQTMSKVFDVKGVRGLGKLMKEIAVMTSTGKHHHKLIGSASIPLRTIQNSGLVLNCVLEKRNKHKPQGTIKIKLNYSSQQNNQVVAQEYKNLLRILLRHELENSKVAHYWWSGEFTIRGEAVLTQHGAQSSLSTTASAFIQWSVYTGIHLDHPLAFDLFDSILDKLVRAIQLREATEDEMKQFWDATKMLLLPCFFVIQNLRKKTAGDRLVVKILTNVLHIIRKISMLQPPEGTDLFPIKHHPWIQQSVGTESNSNMEEALSSAVVISTQDWFDVVKEAHFVHFGLTSDRLQSMIKIIQLVQMDIHRSTVHYDKIFQEIVNFQYTREISKIYELKLAELIKPCMEEIYHTSKRMDILVSNAAVLEHEYLQTGISVFELYVSLKYNFAVDQFHSWFKTGITQWLDISLHKALKRIQKAVELDNLQQVHENNQISSSAVDTLEIFCQIETFWHQLDWPNIEEAYMIVTKILDNTRQCFEFYAECMSAHVESFNLKTKPGDDTCKIFSEWFLAINNVEYVWQDLEPFANKLGVDDIMNRLSNDERSYEENPCVQTIRNILSNAVDTAYNKIMILIMSLIEKIKPDLRRLLENGAELLEHDNPMHQFMTFVDAFASTLHSEVSSINYTRVLDALRRELTTMVNDFIHRKLKNRCSPEFFITLSKELNLVSYFEKIQKHEPKNDCDMKNLAHVQRLLLLHGYETSKLIHQYYIDMLKEQESQEQDTYGMLTVQCFFKNNDLELNILNARNLRPLGTNDTCSTFVRVRFIPKGHFVGIEKLNTQIQPKTLCPLYDEKFNIKLTQEQRSKNDAIIFFSIKNKPKFGISNQYLSEGYLCFSDIEDIFGMSNAIKQKHIKLTRPNLLSNTDCVRVLKYRQNDKSANRFLKKLKKKTDHSSNC